MPIMAQGGLISTSAGVPMQPRKTARLSTQMTPTAPTPTAQAHGGVGMSSSSSTTSMNTRFTDILRRTVLHRGYARAAPTITANQTATFRYRQAKSLQRKAAQAIRRHHICTLNLVRHSALLAMEA